MVSLPSPLYKFFGALCACRTPSRSSYLTITIICILIRSHMFLFKHCMASLCFVYKPVTLLQSRYGGCMQFGIFCIILELEVTWFTPRNLLPCLNVTHALTRIGAGPCEILLHQCAELDRHSGILMTGERPGFSAMLDSL